MKIISQNQVQGEPYLGFTGNAGKIKPEKYAKKIERNGEATCESSSCTKLNKRSDNVETFSQDR